MYVYRGFKLWSETIKNVMGILENLLYFEKLQELDVDTMVRLQLEPYLNRAVIVLYLLFCRGSKVWLETIKNVIEILENLLYLEKLLEVIANMKLF